MRKAVLVLGFLFGALVLTQAQTATPKVTEKQRNQTVRIKEGVQSGALTTVETATLVKDQKELRRMKNRAKADGVVTKKERALLNAKANHNSKKIRRKKNN